MQIALTFGATVVLLIVALSALLGRMQALTVRENAGNALQVVANNAQRVLAIGLHNRLVIVQGLADSPALWKHGLDSDAVVMALAQQQSTGSHIAWMGVAGVDGIVHAASGGLLLGVDVRARPWFAAGLKAVYVGDVHQALLLARLLPPSSTGEPQRFVDFAAPIRVDGEVRGVLALHGSWDWTRSVIESQLPDDAHALAMDLLILDRTGTVIYAPLGHANESIKLGDDLSTINRQKEGTAAVRRWPDGSDYLTAIARLEPKDASADLGWLIVARAPKDLAYAPVRAAIVQVAVAGIVAAVIAMILAWLVAGSISKPLSAIERAAQDLLLGKEGASIPTCASNAELMRLSSALIGMTEGLATRVREHDLLARFDPLTKVLNRRGFEERLEIAVLNAERRGSPLSVIAIDVDHFKRVNDRHGHDVGDTVLQTLACILKTRFRESDSVARMGGEEFIVLLQDTDLAAAARIADDLVATVSTTPFGVVRKITISCGVSRLRASENGLLTLKRADRALYRAKSNGRNRTCTFEEEVAA